MFRFLQKNELKKEVANAKAYLTENYIQPVTATNNFGDGGIRYSLSFPSQADSFTLGDLLDRGYYSKLRAMLERATKLTFVEQVNEYIKQKGLRETTIYKAAQMDRRLFSKVMSDRAYKPSKDTALAMAFSLHLTLEEAEDLLDRAGYSLSNSDKRDIVMGFFFKEKLYDLNKINYILSELQMKCIGR